MTLNLPLTLNLSLNLSRTVGIAFTRRFEFNKRGFDFLVELDQKLKTLVFTFIFLA